MKIVGSSISVYHKVTGVIKLGMCRQTVYDTNHLISQPLLFSIVGNVSSSQQKLFKSAMLVTSYIQP